MSKEEYKGAKLDTTLTHIAGKPESSITYPFPAPLARTQAGH
jgi:hypothetical protein